MIHDSLKPQRSTPSHGETRDKAVVPYHVRMSEPQAFRFEMDGVAGKLGQPNLVPTAISVRDTRFSQDQPRFDRDGVAFIHAPTALDGFTDDPALWQQAYEAELNRLLRDTIGAAEVIVFDHTVRVDDPDAPRRPARNVHSDYTARSAPQRLRAIVGADDAARFYAGHYAFVNVWRPVERPVPSSPLGFIARSTVAAYDWMTIDLIYPDRRGEILGVAHNPDHDWFYRSHMTPDEVAIFSVYDSRGRAPVAHSALDMATNSAAPYPRQSIESRTIVRFA